MISGSGRARLSPGVDQCGGSPGTTSFTVPGVVLLGPFGSSVWCNGETLGPGAQDYAPNLVRLGPLPARVPPYATLPKSSHNGIAFYEVALHRPVSGSGYLVPSLGVELMATGPDATTVLDSIGPSVRERVMAMHRARPPASWKRVGFAGLRFSVPREWAVSRYDLALWCPLLASNPALQGPTPVVLDSDTDWHTPSCAGFAGTTARDGLVVHAGNPKVPNRVPRGAPLLRVNRLHAFVDLSAPFSVLVVEVEVPGRSIPVQVQVGLGDAQTAARVLSSMALN